MQYNFSAHKTLFRNEHKFKMRDAKTLKLIAVYYGKDGYIMMCNGCSSKGIDLFNTDTKNYVVGKLEHFSPSGVMYSETIRNMDV